MEPAEADELHCRQTRFKTDGRREENGTGGRPGKQMEIGLERGLRVRGGPKRKAREPRTWALSRARPHSCSPVRETFRVQASLCESPCA